MFWRRKNKFLKLYELAESKLESSFNIIQIIKNVKSLGILLENQLMDPERIEKIKHNHQNLLNLESSDYDY